MEDDKLWLAKQIDDRTHGNSTIHIDWGNYTISCKSGISGDTMLKNLLVAMAQDYIRLKAMEDKLKQLVSTK